jgi:PleD family two-component response regulator
MRPKVLVVNRNRSQAEQLQHYLEPYFDVLIGTEPDLTLTLLSGLRPWSIVLSLQQRDRSGWMLGRQLRKIPVGRGAFMMVHGDPDNPVPSAFADGGHPSYVDAFITAAELNWEDIRDALVAQARATPELEFDRMLALERAEAEAEDLPVRECPAPRETGPLRSRSWAELLTLPVTLHNIRAVVDGSI